jgi:hypothetical protein
MGIAGTAQAGTFTSGVLVGGAGVQLGCYVTNVGTKPVTVTVTLHEELGNVLTPSVDDCALSGGELAAGQTCFVYRDPAPNYGRCAVEASSSKVRAVLSLLDGGRVSVSVPLTKK